MFIHGHTHGMAQVWYHRISTASLTFTLVSGHL